jgi:hypothetical protein
MRIQTWYSKTFEMLTMFFNDDLKIAIELFFMPFSCDVEGQPTANHRLTGVSQADLIALLVYPTNCFGSHAQKKRFSGILQRARSFTLEAILDGFELIVIPDLHPSILDLRDHEQIARLNLVNRSSHQVTKSGIARLQRCVHVLIIVIVMAVEVVHKYHSLLGPIDCMSAVVSTWFLEVLRPQLLRDETLLGRPVTDSKDIIGYSANKIAFAGVLENDTWITDSCMWPTR